jgi:hypothetical protein
MAIVSVNLKLLSHKRTALKKDEKERVLNDICDSKFSYEGCHHWRRYRWIK